MNASPNLQEGIAEALLRLEAIAQPAEVTPAIVVLPPDSGEFIVGNSGGFVNLAIASLKAAQGERQRFKGLPWVAEADLDWGVAGLQPDPHAHVYLPTKRRRLQNLTGLLLALLLGTCLIVGVVSIVRWMIHSLHP